MKITRKELLKYIVILAFMILILVPLILMRSSLAEEEQYSLEAVLYDTAQVSDSTGTTLTEAGATVNGWEYNTTKYLKIDPNVPADGKTYKVKVILPQEMYVVGDAPSAPAGYSDLQFTKNERIPVNGTTDKYYELKDNSGTLEYTMNYMGESGTILLELRYDNVLWNEQANTTITPTGVNPITVQLIQDGEELKELSISKATTNSKFSGSSDGYLTYIVGSQSYSGAVEALVGNDIGNVTYSYTVNDIYASEYCYFDELKFVLNLPKYTDSNGAIHYFQINESTIKLTMGTIYNATIDTSNQATTGVVTITVPNAYFKHGGTLLTFKYKSLETELANLDKSFYPILFNSGTIKLYGKGKNGTTNITLRSRSLHNIKYIKEQEEKVSLTASGKSVSITDRPQGSVAEFGTAYIANTGTGDSVAKTLKYEFDTGNTGKIKVTTINAMTDTVQQNIEYKYTLVDDAGNRVYLDSSGNRVEESDEGAIGEWTVSLKNNKYRNSAISNLFNTFTRNQLPASHRNYYFKTLEYNIRKIAATARLYSTGGQWGTGSGGIIMGYIADDVVNNEKFTTKVTMTSEGGTIAPISKTFTTTMTTTNNPPIIIDNVKMSETSIIAGENFTFSGRLAVHAYPYGYSQYFNKIRIGMVLPSGVSINDQAITAKTSGGIVITNFDVSSKSIGDGKYLWTVKLPEEQYIGYYNETYAALPTGNSISFSMQLNTSYDMNTATVFAKETLFVAGRNQANSAGGGINYASTVDTYDLNENGSTTDKIAGVNSSNNPSCQIVSQNAMLDVQDSVTVTSNNATTQESSGVSLNTSEDIVTYNLKVNSESGGRVAGFSYYIPIPKTTSVCDNFLIEKSEFEMALNNSAIVNGEDLFDIKYAFDKTLTYAKAQKHEEWYTSDEIDVNDALDYKDVTMIRLTTKVAVIKNGDKTQISLKLKYGGNTYGEEAGMTNVWHSGGYYVHTSGDRETAGNYSTLGVTAELKYNYDNTDITLTAAKDGTPTVIGNVNQIVIDKNLFPSFKKKQTFTILAVETYNVTLQTKSYMQTNIDMPGTDANRTFAITVALDGGAEVDIQNSSETITIGEGTANNSPQFTYRIYNADKISDNSTSRYIVVTLASDNGVTYKQKIIINREVTQASDPESAIVGGKNFIAFDETSSSVTISGDSAFTAQIVTTYIPSVYKNHKFQFSTALPKGAKATLINITDSTEPKYYYYVADGSSKIVDFSSFIKMGTTTTKDYTYYTEADTIKEKLLLIVDLSKAEAGYMNAGSCTLKMIMESDTIDDYASKELTFITTAKRAFSISCENSAEFETDYTVNYEISAQNGAESKYEGRKASLVITMPNTIPADTHLSVNGSMQYLNSDKQFVIPVTDIEEASSSISMQFLSEMLPSTGATYNCNIALWISATANGTSPLLGEKVAEKNMTISAKELPSPALKIMSLNSRIIHQSELSNNITLNYKYTKDSSCKLTIEMMKKVGSGYQKVTDKLSSVNNITTHNMGAFSITGQNGNNNLTLRISSSTEVGTYRFMIRVTDSDGNEILKVPYNFLVVEN